MEILKWANGQGQTIRLDQDEAKELVYLINKALKGIKIVSGFFDPPTEIEITNRG